MTKPYNLTNVLAALREAGIDTRSLVSLTLFADRTVESEYYVRDTNGKIRIDPVTKDAVTTVRRHKWTADHLA